MGAIFDRDKVDGLRIAEVGDTIFVAEDTKTPMTALMPRGPKPKQMLATWPVQAYPRRKFRGTMDGFDISAFSSTNRDELKGTGMWLMSPGWMVTRLAQLTRSAGVKDEMKKQMMDDGLLFAQQVERQICSNADCQEQTELVPWQSRGIFPWLSPSAQSVLPVPAAYRPAAGCQITTPLDEVTANAFEAALGAAADQIRTSVDLTGFVGRRLKRQMSLWAQKLTLTTNEVSLQNFTQNNASKKLSQVVDFFEFDCGVVKTVTSWNLLCDPDTGNDTDYTTRSGAFLDLSMWELCWYDEPALYRMAPQSGGPRGYHDGVFGLKNKNPLGQVSVLTALDT